MASMDVGTAPINGTVILLHELHTIVKSDIYKQETVIKKIR